MCGYILRLGAPGILVFHFRFLKSFCLFEKPCQFRQTDGFITPSLRELGTVIIGIEVDLVLF